MRVSGSHGPHTQAFPKRAQKASNADLRSPRSAEERLIHLPEKTIEPPESLPRVNILSVDTGPCESLSR